MTPTAGQSTSRCSWQAESMKTLKYLSLDSCKPGKIHCVWHLNTTDPLITTRMCIHSKILLQKYPWTQAGHHRAVQTVPETLAYFLLECTGLEAARSKNIPPIRTEMDTAKVVPNTDNTINAILDPSTLSNNPVFIQRTTVIARNLFFYLHLSSRLRLFTYEKIGWTVLQWSRRPTTYSPTRQRHQPPALGASPKGWNLKDKWQVYWIDDLWLFFEDIKMTD